MGYSDQRRGCDGLVWMSLTSRLSLQYLLLLELLFRLPTIMLTDLLACWNGSLGFPAGEAGRAHRGSLPAAGCHVTGRHGDRCPRGHVGRRGGCCFSDVRMTCLCRFWVASGPRACGTPS
jgi:hypothetical protein